MAKKQIDRKEKESVTVSTPVVEPAASPVEEKEETGGQRNTSPESDRARETATSDEQNTTQPVTPGSPSQPTAAETARGQSETASPVSSPTTPDTASSAATPLTNPGAGSPPVAATSPDTDTRRNDPYPLTPLEPAKDENGILKVRAGDPRQQDSSLGVKLRNAELSGNLRELQKLTNWSDSEMEFFMDAIKAGSPLSEVVEKLAPKSRLTPEQEKKERRRKNWQQAIAILGDLGMLAGDFIAAKNGGLVPKRTTTLSGEESKRLENLRREHEAKMDKYRDMMIKAGLSDARTNAGKRMKAFELLTQATAERRRGEQQQAIFDYQKQNAERQAEQQDKKIGILQAQLEQQEKADREKLALENRQLALRKYQIDKDDYWKTISATARGEVKKQPFLINGKTYTIPRPFTDQFYDYLVQEARGLEMLKNSTDAEDLKLLSSYQTLSGGEKKNLALSLMKRHPEQMEKLILQSPFVMESFSGGNPVQDDSRPQAPAAYDYLTGMAFPPSTTSRSEAGARMESSAGQGEKEEDTAPGDGGDETFYGDFWENTDRSHRQTTPQQTPFRQETSQETEIPQDPFRAIVFQGRQKKEREEQGKKERQAQREKEIADQARGFHAQIRNLNAQKKPVIDTEEFIRSQGLDPYGAEARNIRALNAEHKRENARIEQEITNISHKLIYMDPKNQYK